jgi:hypothetical protein
VRKAWKTNPMVSRLSTALRNRCAIPTFPQGRLFLPLKTEERHQRGKVLDASQPPVDHGGNARTVLAGKDSLRRADARPCLLRSVPADLDSRWAAPAGTALGLWVLPVVDKKNVDSAGLLMGVVDDSIEVGIGYFPCQLDGRVQSQSGW